MTEIIRNIRSEVHLCESCSREIGFSPKISDASGAPGVHTSREPVSDSCPSCGCELFDITDSGRAGCPECYSVFSATLDILRGDYSYKGTAPINRRCSPHENISDGRIIIHPVDDLKRDLVEAVEDERYEDAAQLRDLIREREGSYKP